MAQAAVETRKSSPAPAPTPETKSAKSSRPLASSLSMRSPLIQPKLTVNTSGDAYEQEADAVASAVMSTPAPLPQPDLSRTSGLQRMAEDESVQRVAEEESVQRMPAAEDAVQRMTEDDSVQRVAEEESVQRMATEEPVQRKGTGSAKVSSSTAATIRSPGSGAPLPNPVRSRIEPNVGANLSGVRVHSGPSAQRAASSIGARAFTHSNNIFLNRSESSHNLGLMAHESTHVVQQGAAPVQRKPLEDSEPAVQRKPITSSAPPDIQRFIPDAVLEELADYARHIPGYTLFTVLIEYDPLRGREVPRTAMTMLEGLMGLVPFGTYIFDTLREKGVIQAAFDWVSDELRRLNLSISRIEQTVENAWEDVRLIEGFDYNLNVVVRHFNRLYEDVVAFAESLVDKIIDLIKEAVIETAESLLAENKAWSLLKKIIKYDPLRDEAVEASTVEILEDFLLLIGREQELEQMKERGTLQETADWIDTQIETFQFLLETFNGLISDAWDAIQPENLLQLDTNLENLATRAGTFLEDVWTFASTVALKVLELIKQALLSWLSTFATDIPGYHLLTVMLRKDPFTNEAVPRTPINLIRGFMSLLPGGERQFQQMNETGVIPQAAQRIEAAMATLGITWPFVQQLFIDLWNAFTIEDLLAPIEAFTRILDQFGEPIGRLVAFVIEVIKVVMGLILEMMNFPSDLVGSIITNALQALDDIKRDPIGFLINLLNALKRGFDKFFGNILTHLLDGLTGWLFGQLAKAGIQPPSELSLETVLDLVFQLLGVTIDNLWQKLADRIGQDKVDKLRSGMQRLEGIWTFIQDVQERGVAAIWEKIESQISNLWNMVLEKVQNFVMVRVIQQMTARLLSMLDPTGIMAVINSFVAFFDAVQSAIEYFREILEIINSFTTTVAEIARGSVEGAAQFLENTLAMSLPVAIGFLANQVGLGDLGERIGEIIADIRALIDQAIDWLIDQAMRLGEALLRSLGLTNETENSEDLDPTNHVAVATRAANDLKQVDSTSQQNYDFIRSAKEEQAQQIEERYSAILESGIKLSIVFDDKAADKADDDIDFRVVIAPNTTTLPSSIPTTPAVPVMSFSPGFSNSRATSPVTVRHLHDSPGNHEPGRPPSSSRNREAFSILQAFNISQNWVRFHILNHNIGGRNAESNLIPMSRDININEYEPNFEKPMKDKFDAGKVLWMSAGFTYHFDGIFIQSYNAQGGEMMFDSAQNQWIEDPANAVPNFSTGDLAYPRSEAIAINELYRFGFDFQIQRALEQTNVGITFMRELFEFADEKGVSHFNGVDDLSILAEDIIIARGHREGHANRLRSWISSTTFEF